MLILQADYSQAESDVVDYLVQNEEAKQDRINGIDTHKKTASLVFEIPINEVTEEQRDPAKKLTHGAPYGIGPKAMAKILERPYSETRPLLEKIYRVKPYIQKYQKYIRSVLHNNKMTLTDPFGKRYKFRGRLDDTLYRSAYSRIPQSTVGTMMSRALVKFYLNFGPDYDIILSLYDAGYFSVSPITPNIIALMSKIELCMLTPLTIHGDLLVIDIDFKLGKTWGDMFDIDVTMDNKLVIKQGDTWVDYSPELFNV